ncbi:hypothetical protein C1646_809599 [Rhizophagus diaphanus]|nr:hypothetical protein C1646_809599 [Rhizophagus diaphanus] [Rhizophagus sp. MUCL 43196]
MKIENEIMDMTEGIKAYNYKIDKIYEQIRENDKRKFVIHGFSKEQIIQKDVFEIQDIDNGKKIKWYWEKEEKVIKEDLIDSFYEGILAFILQRKKIQIYAIEGKRGIGKTYFIIKIKEIYKIKSYPRIEIKKIMEEDYNQVQMSLERNDFEEAQNRVVKIKKKLNEYMKRKKLNMHFSMNKMYRNRVFHQNVIKLEKQIEKKDGINEVYEEYLEEIYKGKIEV